ncbi:hypothetical protein GCM10028778_01510 [Barrientosiimonas marina]|uniref:Spore cortex biosynthesis protein YabQ n=1 Tax=Lentibacillus kimchii TaxID=1542911 RepID=A0ABW2UUD4_9BACI
MTLDVQFLTMISMAAGGFWLGMALETFRRLSIYWRERAFLVYVMEISFWLTQTLLLYYILFRVNSGELRFYVFAALVLGFAIYQALAASLYKRLLEYVIYVMAAIHRMLTRIIRAVIVTPIVFSVQLLLAAVGFMGKWLWHLLRFILKVFWVPVSWLLRLGFQMLPQTIQKKIHKLAGFYSTIKNRCKKWIQHIMFKRR